ncbi:MAG: catechol 1,2-dioxygenase [Candidatus Eremiobacteraeota bacterium]|nr:catechol 1,2-dioxygenase [Candidatus Eremiobacteraeota bacterium]
MGELVAGLFSTHVPRLMILDPEARRAYMGDDVTTFYDALPQLHAERIAPLDFDTFVIIDTHWHSTLDFILNAHERHEGIYTSDEIPWMINEYAYDYPGDPELARLIEEEATASGDHAQSSSHVGLPIHYGTLNPMHYYNPGPKKRRVLPISVCDTAEVEANVRFGEVLARAVARSDRRVLLIASGGMSHKFWDLAVIRDRASADPRDINGDERRRYDERIMTLWREGDHRAVLALAEDFRRTCSPEGRFAHYLVLAGAFGRGAGLSKGQQFGRYEAAIGTGQAIFWFDPVPNSTAVPA